jgi:hypothetical protein
MVPKLKVPKARISCRSTDLNLSKLNSIAVKHINIIFPNYSSNFDRLCCLVVRVPGCITEIYCVSFEVRTEFIYVM